MSKCVVVGFNDGNFSEYRDWVSLGGENSGAFRDLRLATVEYDGEPRRALDLLNVVAQRRFGAENFHLHNMDFPAPAVTVLGAAIDQAGFDNDALHDYQTQKHLLLDGVRRGDVEMVIVTTTFYVHPDPVIEIVNDVRRTSDDVTIVVGGPYVHNASLTMESSDFADLLTYLGADFYIVSRDGEASLVALLNESHGEQQYQHVPNLMYRNSDGDFVYTHDHLEQNGISIPRWEPTTSHARARSFLSVRTAKSCPFSCAFCAFPARSGKYDFLALPDVESYFNEIAEQYGQVTMSFIDDTFNVPRRRFHEILEMMIRNEYGFKWNSFLRSDHANDKTIELMAEAGCEGVFLGVESGSDSMLERMEKTSRTRHYRFAIEKLRSAHILSYASLIIGFPGETRETVAETRRFVEETAPDFYRAQLWYCDPSTPIWERRDQYDIQGTGFSWRHRTMDAQEACDIVDHLFLNVANSTWLPQWGFEQWSLFYLQRLGLSYADVKNFVKAFNGLVRSQIFDHTLDVDHCDDLQVVIEVAEKLIAASLVQSPVRAANELV